MIFLSSQSLESQSILLSRDKIFKAVVVIASSTNPLLSVFPKININFFAINTYTPSVHSIPLISITTLTNLFDSFNFALAFSKSWNAIERQNAPTKAILVTYILSYVSLLFLLQF